MKLVLVMIGDEDKDKVSKELVEAGYTPTLMASTGEFFQFGKSILLVGVEADQIDALKAIIDKTTTSSQIKGGEVLKANLYVMSARLERLQQK